MAVICLYFFDSSFLTLSTRSLYALNFSPVHFNREILLNGNIRRSRGRRSSTSGVVALSTHSNQKILKSNRRSRYGQTLSPYGSNDDDDDGGGKDEDWDADTLSDNECAEMDEFGVDIQKFKSHKEGNMKRGSQRKLEENQGKSSSNLGQSLKIADNLTHLQNSKDTSKDRNYGSSCQLSNRSDFVDTNEKGKLNRGKYTEKMFHQLSEELDLDEKLFPLIDYLSTFGFKVPHFVQIYERHMPSLQLNVDSAQERLEYLLSIGVKHKDIRKILLRQPQILEYTVENNLKSHVAFLIGLGIPDSRIPQIITAAPSLFSYSVKHSLKPTVRYLIEEVGINERDLKKVVQLSPQILVQRIDNSWNTRFDFLTKELGAPKESVVKMVTKHPQLLHYSIEDGLLPRINFLRSIGMQNSDILKVLTSLAQVLSLSLEGNLKPKYMYLVNELRNEVKSLTKYPMYFSLSLDQRIRPRHKFLVALKKAPRGPFPLGLFVPTDEYFCQQWAGTSLDKYLAFRQSLLLKELAKKYERKG